MREIKFRAWDKDEKKMSKVIGIEQNKEGEVYVYETDDSVTEFHPKHNELMQYTGLKDKNGKDVYEGDRVKFRSHPEKTRIMEIIYDTKSARFMAQDIDGWHSFQHYNDLEVIGNIYENKGEQE